MNQFTLPLVALAISYTLATQSQTVHGVTGANAWMQGGTSTTLDDAFSVLNNPSRMSHQDKWQSGVYHENRFGRRELALSSFCLAVPTPLIDAGIGISSYGFNDFNKQRFTLSASKKLAQTFSLGVQANYIHLNMNEYGQSGAWVLGAGVSYQPTSKITIGFVIYNPNQRQLPGKPGVQLPSFARSGVQYRFNNKVRTLFEAEQQTGYKTILRGGIRYDIHKRISVAAGAASAPLIYSFGTSVKLAGVIIDMAAGIHQVLGVTPQVSLRYPSNL